MFWRAASVLGLGLEDEHKLLIARNRRIRIVALDVIPVTYPALLMCRCYTVTVLYIYHSVHCVKLGSTLLQINWYTSDCSIVSIVAHHLLTNLPFEIKVSNSFDIFKSS